jgi:hypothetical protein
MQPVLFRSNGRYYVKVDHTAIPVTEASGFAEAAEFLFMCFFVFWVEYPDELKLFYGFLEHVVGIKSSKAKGTTLTDLCRRVSHQMALYSSDG